MPQISINRPAVNDFEKMLNISSVTAKSILVTLTISATVESGLTSTVTAADGYSAHGLLYLSAVLDGSHQ
jgi:hypothetical protein